MSKTEFTAPLSPAAAAAERTRAWFSTLPGVESFAGLLLSDLVKRHALDTDTELRPETWLVTDLPETMVSVQQGRNWRILLPELSKEDGIWYSPLSVMVRCLCALLERELAQASDNALSEQRQASLKTLLEDYQWVRRVAEYEVTLYSTEPQRLDLTKMEPLTDRLYAEDMRIPVLQMPAGQEADALAGTDEMRALFTGELSSRLRYRVIPHRVLQMYMQNDKHLRSLTSQGLHAFDMLNWFDRLYQWLRVSRAAVQQLLDGWSGVYDPYRVHLLPPPVGSTPDYLGWLKLTKNILWRYGLLVQALRFYFEQLTDPLINPARATALPP